MSTNIPQAGERRFPDGFVWGAATAAYQIEGATTEDGRGESIWDRYSHTPGRTLNGDTGDVACDHYHRWRDDIQLMRELGLQAYRFSIAWPRIVPDGRGRVNEAGLAFYDRLVDGLLEAGITPWATLYHWDLPQALEDEGGWPNRATADAFAEYTDSITRRLGDRVKHWITLNEPWCSAFLGYRVGRHAPGRTNFQDALAAMHTLLLGHGKAVPIIRRNSPDAQVGITLNLAQVYPATNSAADQAAARRFDGYFNRWILDPLYGRGYPQDMLELYGAMTPPIEADDVATIAAPMDFLGLNYYYSNFIRAAEDDDVLHIGEARLEGAEYTAMNWPVVPRGLYDQLLHIPREYPTGPLYITENGAAYPGDQPQEENGTLRVRDPERTRYYAQHLAMAQRAIEAGSPLQGYFAWSLMDNFEWAYGYTRRFGITYVDYETQQRIIKDSGKQYQQVIAANAVVEP